MRPRTDLQANMTVFSPVMVLISFSASCQLVLGQPAKTAGRFLVDDGHLFLLCLDGKVLFNPKSIEQAQTNATTLPAEEDPGGNWGWVADGLQLSIRFNKLTFTVGEQVVAKLTFRNVSHEERTFLRMLGGEDFDLVVTLGKKDLQRIIDPFAMGSIQVSAVHPHTQQVFEFPVSEKFDLSEPGEYLIYAKRLLPKSDGDDYMELRSGNAIIQIVEPPPRGQPGENATLSSPPTTAIGKANVETTRLAPARQGSAPPAQIVDSKPAAHALNPAPRVPGILSATKPSKPPGTARPPAASPPKASTHHFGFLQLAASAVGVLALAVIAFILHRARTRQKRADQ